MCKWIKPIRSLKDFPAMGQPPRLIDQKEDQDDTEHQMTQLARRFANRLKGRFGLPVWLVDERLTSVIAEAMHRALQWGVSPQAALQAVAGTRIRDAMARIAVEALVAAHHADIGVDAVGLRPIGRDVLGSGHRGRERGGRGGAQCRRTGAASVQIRRASCRERV